MGLNIYLVTKDREDHPHWDSSRYAGDKDFPEWVSGLTRTYVERNEFNEFEDIFRPDNIQDWRDCLPKERSNVERFPKMFDILEQNLDYYIYLSW